MNHRLIAVAAALFVPATAKAAACEDSFRQSGNVVSGLRFTASVSVADLTPASAIGQLRGIVLSKGYTVMAAEAQGGSMLIEQPMTGSARSFPIEISATDAGGTGQVRMEARLRAAMSVPGSAARTEMCGMLTRLRGGREGLALAAQGMAAGASSTAAPIRMSVLAFSSQMATEAIRNAPAVEARHRGRSFTLWGPVGNVGRSGENYRVDFQLLENVLTTLLPGSGNRLEVSCELASDQSAYALTLRTGRRVELTGVFDRYQQGQSTIFLRDCRPAARR